MGNGKKEIKLQFGSGAHILKDYINIDLTKEFGAQIACDMNKFPYPFPDNYADEILCEMTLEHINFPTGAIDEFHRIIKPTGTVYLRVPHFSHAYSFFADIHVSTFNVGYFWGRKHTEIELDMWNNKLLPGKHWHFFDKNKKWKDVKVELVFPKGYLFIFSLPWQFLFGKNKIMQGIYENILSTFYRACEIKVIFKMKG